MRGLLALAVALLATAPLQAQSVLLEPLEFPATYPGPSAQHPGGGCFRLASGTIAPGDVDWVQVRIPWASTLTIVDVLPNGSLVIEGRRQTKIGGETTDAVLRGLVRQEDVTANNTVYSYNVAEASIQYLSKGPVSDAQRRGWFSWIWGKVTPF